MLKANSLEVGASLIQMQQIKITGILFLLKNTEQKQKKKLTLKPA